MQYPFTVRVYGILLDANRILLCDERYRNTRFTKFPGGGLQFGEGPPDGLRREWREELSLDIDVTRHFYTTDFFQASAFDPAVQVVSLYYLVKPAVPLYVAASEKPFDFPEDEERSISFRWVAMDRFTGEDVTFPIDRKVAGLVRQFWENGRMPE